MPFIVTETHWEYDDERYHTADAFAGNEPGYPVAIFESSEDAEADRWQRELDKWNNLHGHIGGYIEAFTEDVDNDNRRNYSEHCLQRIREFKENYATIMGVDVDSVKFGYEFNLPENITDSQLRKIVELCDGPCFFNVFELS